VLLSHRPQAVQAVVVVPVVPSWEVQVHQRASERSLSAEMEAMDSSVAHSILAAAVAAVRAPLPTVAMALPAREVLSHHLPVGQAGMLVVVMEEMGIRDLVEMEHPEVHRGVEAVVLLRTMVLVAAVAQEEQEES